MFPSRPAPLDKHLCWNIRERAVLLASFKTITTPLRLNAIIITHKNIQSRYRLHPK